MSPSEHMRPRRRQGAAQPTGRRTSGPAAQNGKVAAAPDGDSIAIESVQDADQLVAEYLAWRGATDALGAFADAVHSSGATAGAARARADDESKAQAAGKAGPDELGEPKIGLLPAYVRAAPSADAAERAMLRAFDRGDRGRFLRLWARHVPWTSIRRHDGLARRLELYLRVGLTLHGHMRAEAAAQRAAALDDEAATLLDRAGGGGGKDGHGSPGQSPGAGAGARRRAYQAS